MVGNFNEIRHSGERVGTGNNIDDRDTEAFDDFIVNNQLIDQPLFGRCFTWYRPDGSCKSRLDRILVNTEW